ncbi:MAG: AAA family ATPase, partial [Chloroflexi bacterium]|nr:AAA family ATPase [Chloroflexota bacterium]
MEENLLVTELVIHNFRTYQDCKIIIYPYGLLAGSNNCGKSNLVDAIRVFYEDIKYNEERDFPKFPTIDQEAWLELEFRPSPKEFDNLKEDYRQIGGTFRVRKYLKSESLDSEGNIKSGIYAYIRGELSDSRFYGAKNVQQGKLGKIIHIPPVSIIGENTKLTGPSPLRDLLNVVIESILESSESYSELKSAFDVFDGKLKVEENDDGISLTTIESEVTAELDDWQMDFKLSINPLDQS